MFFLYSAALGLLLVLASPYWLWRALRQGKYRAGFSERLGNVPKRLRRTPPEENCIWIHAVSLGEVMAISQLGQALQSRFGAKGWRIVISTTTATGQKLARERFGEENVFYLPMDFAWALMPFFAALRPRMLVLAETEFWPNLLRLAHKNKSRVAVVNARISDRSLPRYRRFRGLLKKVLANVDLFLAQSEIDRERLASISADSRRIQVSGNLKFEAASVKRSDAYARLRAAIPPASNVLVCGSTVDGEEKLLLRAFRLMLETNHDALMVLAPRHPERFAEVGAILQKEGWIFWRRSEWNGQALGGGVLLLDTIGELAGIYELATAAFVGGSLVPRGGHNILEPARFGKPIFVGPYTENFRDIITIFQKANAVHVLDSAQLDEELPKVFDMKWRAMGQRGRQIFESQSGALQRTLDALEVLMWMPSSIKQQYQQVAE